MIRLRVTTGPHEGEEVSTCDSSLSIGRETKTDLPLPNDLAVSKYHGEFSEQGASIWYRDLESRNGSRITQENGSSRVLGPISPACEIHQGDLVRVGNSCLEVLEAAAQSMEDMVEQTIAIPPSRTIDTAFRKDESSQDFLQRFLRLPQASDGPSTPQTAGKTFLEVFPQADSVAIIEVSATAEVPQRSDLLEKAITCFSRKGNASRHYSLHVLQEAHRRQSVVSFHRELNDSLFDVSESLIAANVTACLCGPLFDNGSISGFVQLLGQENATFTARDQEVFGMLTGVTSILMSQTRLLKEREKTRRLASVGQAIAALSHDVKNILDSLGSFADDVENDLPSLRNNENWQYVRQDLNLMRFLAKDTRVRLTGDESQPKHRLNVAETIDPILEACQRYFVQESDRKRVQVINECESNLEVWVRPNVLWIAVMNCVKNAIDACLLRDTDRPDDSKTWVIKVRTFAETNGKYCLLSICDQAGGIPRDVLNRMGRELVSTKGEKGTGLGFQIVVDSMKRLNGAVIVATSGNAIGSRVPGTIVSLRLPRSQSSPVIKDDDILLFVPPEAHFAKILGNENATD